MKTLPAILTLSFPQSVWTSAQDYRAEDPRVVVVSSRRTLRRTKRKWQRRGYCSGINSEVRQPASQDCGTDGCGCGYGSLQPLNTKHQPALSSSYILRRRAERSRVLCVPTIRNGSQGHITHCAALLYTASHHCTQPCRENKHLEGDGSWRTRAAQRKGFFSSLQQHKHTQLAFWSCKPFVGSRTLAATSVLVNNNSRHRCKIQYCRFTGRVHTVHCSLLIEPCSPISTAGSGSESWLGITIGAAAETTASYITNNTQQ